jgi:hypothetical protein
MEDLEMPAIAARSLFFALLLTVCSPAFALEDTPQNREQQANRWLDALPPQSMIDNMTDRIAENAPAGQQDKFKAAVAKNVDVGRIATAMRTAMVKHFTADELQALADFYGSALGKSATAKMQNYMAEVTPETMGEFQVAVEKAQEDFHPAEQKTEEPKPDK